MLALTGRAGLRHDGGPEANVQDLISSVIQGFPVGCVFALVAVGFVLTYKVSGVFNLAFGAQAFAAAAVYYVLRVQHGWPTPPAAIVAILVVSPLIGIVMYLAIYRYLRTAPPVARLAVSIGLLVALPAIVKLVLQLGDSPLYGVEGIVGKGDTLYAFFDYNINRDQLATIFVTLASVLGLTLMFRYSTIGLRMRAVVESARMTELAGISADRVSSAGWALSSILAGTAGVLLGPLFPQLSSQNFFLLIVAAIAAAAFAGLSSLPLALGGGLALGIGAQILSRELPTDSILSQGLRPSLPFVVLFFVLILKPSIRRKREVTDPLAGVDPPPPSLAPVERGQAQTWLTWAFASLFCVVVVWLFGYVFDAYYLSLATQTVIFSIIFLSFTVFTGMAGEISLAQGSFAAIGAFTVGQLATRWDVSVFVGAAAGIALAAVVGMLLAIPALRLGGIYLALATLAFALFFGEVIVKFDWAGGGLLPVSVPRPTLGSIDFSNDRTFFFLCIALLILACAFVVRMRKGSTGLSLRALAGSEVAGSSVGLSPARARITAFAVSAGLAAAGGILLSMREGAANYQANFTVEFALFWLVLVVTLGPRTVEGAIVAAIALKFFPELIDQFNNWQSLVHVSPSWQFILFGLGAVAYARHPEGMFEYVKRRVQNSVQHQLDRFTRRAAPLPAATTDASDATIDVTEPTAPTFDAPPEGVKRDG
ncbi:MAG: ABC transporter permease [Acidimicrobiia bacterium]